DRARQILAAGEHPINLCPQPLGGRHPLRHGRRLLPQTSLVFEGTYVRLLLHRRWDTTLNTGVSWLLAGPLDTLPESLRGAAQEVRDALSAGEVREFQLLYVHNCPESENVAAELTQAQQTADSIIK